MNKYQEELKEAKNNEMKLAEMKKKKQSQYAMLTGFIGIGVIGATMFSWIGFFVAGMLGAFLGYISHRK